MNIFLEAFVDKNLGDDLMLQLLVKRYPQAMFYSIGPEQYNQATPYKDWRNFIITSRHFWKAFLPQFDGYVNIGGSVWQDYGENQLWYEVRSQTVEQMSRLNRPRLMIGNNVGPVTTEEGAIFFESIMRKLNDITFRDRASYEWAASRLASDQARLTSDVVFALPFQKDETDPNLIGFTIHRDIVKVEQNQTYIEQMRKLIERLLSREAQLKICLYAFDTGVTQNDAISIAEILEGVEAPFQERVSTLNYEGDIEKFINHLSRCRHIFASHFHAVVLAILMDIPFTAFAYQNKTVDFLADLGYKGTILNYENMTQCEDETVEAVFRDQVEYDRSALKHMIEASLQNFQQADFYFQDIRMDEKNNYLEIVQKVSELNQMNEKLSILHSHQQAEIAETTRQLRDAKSVANENARQLQDAKSVVEEITRQLQDAKQVAEEASKQLIEARSVIEKLNHELTETGKRAETLSDSLNSAEDNLAKKDLHIAELVNAGALRRQEMINLSYEIALLHSEIASLKNSFSWKLTSPIRNSKKIIKKILRRGG